MVDAGVGTKLLVVSDLHAIEGALKDKSPSNLAFSGTSEAAKKLFSDVSVALAQQNVSNVDYLLCAGDITNRAGSRALARAWESLDTLANELGAQLIATAGNHDYASHEPDADATDEDFPDEVDPKDALLQLRPPFPIRTDAGRQSYFSYSYAIDDAGPAIVVSLNSCTYHGLANDKSPEYMHGRVSQHTVENLKSALKPYVSDGRPRVLLTHHHPVQLPNRDLRERSQIIDGNLLVSALEADGAWIIVHGHKHRPWIQYGFGGGGAPVILSSGSFSANLGGGKFGSSLANQFHLIEVLTQDQHGLDDLDVAGSVRSWTHDPYRDPVWYPAGPNQGFMAYSGFGWRVGPHYLAPRMLDWIQSQEGTITEDALLGWEPRIQYLTPDDLDRTYNLVARRGNLKVDFTSTGQFSGVTLPTGGGGNAS